MSSGTWWALVASIPFALLIMIIAFIVLRININKVKSKYAIGAENSQENPVLDRKDYGKLLWDLKDKTKNPLNDLSMEYAINTILRNKYERLVVVGFKEKYEETTLVKMTSGKISKATFDFALVNFDEKLIDGIDDLMKRAEPKSIIMIANTPKSKEVKKLLTYLKYTGVRNEYQKVDSGIILIAK